MTATHPLSKLRRTVPLTAALIAAGLALAPVADAAAPTAPSVRAGRAPAPKLLPDLTPLRASELYVQASGGVRKLRFEAGLANIGAGPMEVRPNRAKPCPKGKRHASQVVYRDVDRNGFFKRSVDKAYTQQSAGCMVFHPQHNHWHFEAASRYRLFRPGHEDNILVRARKMSFCLRDSERVPAEYGTFYQPLYYRDCGRETPQGISRGWVDVYANYLTGQALTLPKNLRHGVFCLNIRVDPKGRLDEGDETNNNSFKAFRLKQGTVIQPVGNRICEP